MDEVASLVLPVFTTSISTMIVASAYVSAAL